MSTVFHVKYEYINFILFSFNICQRNARNVKATFVICRLNI